MILQQVLLSLALLCPQERAAIPASADIALDARTRSEVIDAALAALESGYVFPEVAAKMAASVREKQSRNGYDSLERGMGFAEQLTQDLQAISHDKHLRVRFRPEPLPPEPERTGEPSGPTPEEIEELRRESARDNFGFVKAERLEGNVGYLDFRHFAPPALAGETAAAAMAFLANTDALIIDLRQNGGGDPGMVAFMCSYLFGVESVHLNDLYFRPSNETQQFWTSPYVPGPKYVGKDVYVLTSNRTFSGAEEFAYNLKTQERATLVGETTGGGANPGGMERLHDHFVLFVPSGRAINPITKTNWEGTGVGPDVAIAAPRALAKAHTLAIEKLIQGAQSAALQEERTALLERLERELESAPEKKP